MSKQKIWYTHDNGGRPFKVVIHSSKSLSVYRIIDETDSDEDQKKKVDKYDESKPVLECRNVAQIFIGKSPKNEMTKFSGGHGRRFHGSSILVHESKDNYIFIGESIKRFKTKTPIIEYVSPVGNSDVPYPYAIDVNGDYYLMIENVKLHVEKLDADVFKILKRTKDPYQVYYGQYEGGSRKANKHASSSIRMKRIAGRRY